MVINNQRRIVIGWVGVGLMNTLNGCAAAEPDTKVRHTLRIEVHKSVGGAKNILFTYGDEIVALKRPSAIAAVPFLSYTSSMKVPEEFEISWETPDGKKHEAKVPVRSQIKRSVKNKAIVFVIMQDHVEGYIDLSMSYGGEMERFY